MIILFDTASELPYYWTMKMRSRILTCVLMLAIGASTHSFGSDERPSPEAMAADAVIGRPLCFAATVLGAAFFVVALPVAAITKSVRPANGEPSQRG